MTGLICSKIDFELLGENLGDSTIKLIKKKKYKIFIKEKIRKAAFVFLQEK